MAFKAVQAASLLSDRPCFMNNIVKARGAECFRMNPAHDNGNVVNGGLTGLGQIIRVSKLPVQAK